MKKVIKIAAVAALAFTVGCNGGKSSAEPESKPVLSAAETPEVTTIVLAPKMFTYDVVSNGKVAAREYADLTFASTGTVIERVAVRNGQRVKRNQEIAALDRFRLENDLSTAQNQLDRSRLELADALIGQGYDPERMDLVPPEVLRLARLRSGIAQAEMELRQAERALDDATLRAPYDGVVANLEQKAGNKPDGSKPFCRVIAASGMEVIFPVLESELGLVHAGDAVEVTSYATGNRYRGQVETINPVVDKDGMVQVSARIDAAAGLFDGMNVRVDVKRQVERALAVPKSAVVLRSGGRQVVFTYEDGKAIWNYVTTSLENMNEYVIAEGLTEGQQVIVDGNFNLAHQSPVRLVE